MGKASEEIQQKFTAKSQSEKKPSPPIHGFIIIFALNAKQG